MAAVRSRLRVALAAVAAAFLPLACGGEFHAYYTRELIVHAPKAEVAVSLKHVELFAKEPWGSGFQMSSSRISGTRTCQGDFRGAEFELVLDDREGATRLQVLSGATPDVLDELVGLVEERLDRDGIRHEVDSVRSP
jgi:hypothetical protein